MTLNEFVAKYDGLKVGDGQCGTLVRQYWIEVDKTNPPSYLNSKDYWFNPVPGYDKVATPIPGAIAIYNSHGAYPEGHSAIYYDGRVFEQNADPDHSPAHLYQRANTYLLGYLVKQGATTMGKPSEKEVKDYFAGFEVTGLSGIVGVPSAEQITYYTAHTYDVILSDILQDVWNRYDALRKAPAGNFTPYSGPQLFTKS